MSPRQFRIVIAQLAAAHDALLQIEEVNVFDHKIMRAKENIRQLLAEKLVKDASDDLGISVTKRGVWP